MKPPPAHQTAMHLLHPEAAAVQGFLNGLFTPTFPMGGLLSAIGGGLVKMIDAQSIVVASTATRWLNHEGDSLRVFFSSIASACRVGLYVTLQACVWPFTLMVVH